MEEKLTDHLTQSVRFYITLAFGIAFFALALLPYLLGFTYAHQFAVSIIIWTTFFTSISTYLYGKLRPQKTFEIASYEFLFYAISVGLVIHFLDYLNGSFIFMYGLLILGSAYFLKSKYLEYLGGITSLFVVAEYFYLIKSDLVVFTLSGFVFVLLRVLYLVLLARVGKDLAANVSAQRKQYEQLVKLNRQLGELDKLKGEFIDFASHQLKTPLTVIRGNISMILDGDFGKVDNKLATPLREISIGIDRLNGTINNVVDTLKFDEGIPLQANMELTDIKQLVETELETSIPSTLIKSVRIFFKSEANIPKIYVDSEKMKLAFSTILEDSIRHTLKGGKIEVSVFKDTGAVNIQITNDGPEMFLFEGDKVFEKLTKRNGDPATVTNNNLNFYVVKRILDSHGGKVNYQKGESGGNIFTISIPVSRIEKKNRKRLVKKQHA